MLYVRNLDMRVTFEKQDEHVPKFHTTSDCVGGKRFAPVSGLN